MSECSRELFRVSSLNRVRKREFVAAFIPRRGDLRIFEHPSYDSLRVGPGVDGAPRGHIATARPQLSRWSVMPLGLALTIAGYGVAAAPLRASVIDHTPSALITGRAGVADSFSADVASSPEHQTIIPRIFPSSFGCRHFLLFSLRVLWHHRCFPQLLILLFPLVLLLSFPHPHSFR
eukprot:GHVU01167918.1.p1 GENE.GHVU01167918.1~~GHVU01167918.1.p1  ORF type:complete len:177 (+),score=2.51 GHVU01167918.1:553-1083(+)